jgi:hypothetical protein
LAIDGTIVRPGSMIEDRPMATSSRSFLVEPMLTIARLNHWMLPQ